MDYDIDLMWNQYQQLTENIEDSKNKNPYISACTSCGSKNCICEDMVNGVIVCTHCGTVIENDIIDNRPEWSFNSEDTTRKDPARCGAVINPLLEKSSMSTLISQSGFKCPNNFHFMRKLHNQMSMNYVERSRYHVFENISKMAGETGKLSNNVIEQAKYYYMILSQRKLSRGEIRKGLIACCILHACRNMNVPRSMREISKMTNVSIPILNKTTKIFLKHMNDVLLETSQSFERGIDKARYCDYVFEHTKCSDLIQRYCNALHIPEKTNERKLIRSINKMENELNEHGVMDCKTPAAITCGLIIFNAEKLNFREITKTRVSNLFQVSIVTINKIIKMIISFYDTTSNEQNDRL